MNNPKYASITHDDDYAGYHKGHDKQRRLAASTINVLKN